MPIFSEIEEGRADQKYNSPEIDDMRTKKYYSFIAEQFCKATAAPKQ
jgi:hypothetical protein